MRVFECNTLLIDFFKDDNFLLVKRQDSNKTDIDEYKKQIREWRLIIEKYRPEKQLVDYSEYSFPITPELQQFTNENLLKPAYGAGIRKVAFLIAHDLFAQMSVEQIMKQDTGKIFEIRYFDNFEKAKDWLLMKVNS